MSRASFGSRNYHPMDVDTPARQATSSSRTNDPLEQHISYLLKHTKDLARLCIKAAEELSESHQLEEVPDLKNTLREAVVLRNQLQNMQSLYRESVSKLNRSNCPDDEIKAIQTTLKEALESSPEINDRNIPEIQEFKRRVFEAAGDNEDNSLMEEDENADDDADIVIASTKQSFICPLTRARFVDPVKNPACGHSYSSSAIQTMLRGHIGSCSCPISGCRQSVSAAALRTDDDLIRKMERMNNRIF